MGISERKEREREALRQKFIDAGREMFLKEGYEKTSLRAIAKSVEYSPGTIYLHFKNKDELFYAIHASCFNLLGAEMEGTMDIAHPVERLRKLGETYLSFAFKYPDYYDLMFVAKSPMNAEPTEEKWAAVANTFGCLESTVRECIDEGYFKGKDLNTTTFTIWSTMHGMITLSICDRLKMYPEGSQKQMLEDAVEMLVDMLQK